LAVDNIRRPGISQCLSIQLIEVVELKRRHVGNVQEALDDVRLAIAQLVKKRDERRDSFASGIKTAMATPFGEDAEEVHKLLGKHGISSRLAEQVVTIAEQRTPYTLFGVVDALTAGCIPLFTVSSRCGAFMAPSLPPPMD